jgi:hypothetical protein
MWLLRYQYGEMTQVELCPEEFHDPLNESRSTEPISKSGDEDDRKTEPTCH